MGVELRIEASAGVLTERCSDDPLSVDTHHVSVDPPPGVSMILHPTQDSVHRSIMSPHHLTPYLFVTETEQDRDRLGSREGGVVTTRRRLTHLPAKVGAGGRMFPIEESMERSGLDITIQPQTTSSPTPPTTRRLITINVIGGQVVGVIAARPRPLQSRHPDRHHKPPETGRPQVCTRLSDFAVRDWMVIFIAVS